jgi:hypothetical protein
VCNVRVHIEDGLCYLCICVKGQGHRLHVRCDPGELLGARRGCFQVRLLLCERAQRSWCSMCRIYEYGLEISLGNDP